MGTYCRSDGMDGEAAAAVMRQRVVLQSLPRFSVQAAPLNAASSCAHYQTYPGADHGVQIVVKCDELRQVRTERCVLSSQFEDLSPIDVTAKPDMMIGGGGPVRVRKKVRAKRVDLRPLQNLKGKICSKLGSAMVINKCNTATSYKPTDLPESSPAMLARSSQFTSSSRSKVVTKQRAAAGTGVFYMTPGGISEFMTSEEGPGRGSGDNNVERLSQLAAVACELEQQRSRGSHQGLMQDLSNQVVTWNRSCETIRDCCSFTATQAVKIKRRRTPRKSCRLQLPIAWNYAMSRPMQHDVNCKSPVGGDLSASDSCSRPDITLLIGCSDVRSNESHVGESVTKNLAACTSMTLNSRMDHECSDQSRNGKILTDPNLASSELSRSTDDLTRSARRNSSADSSSSGSGGGADTSILSKFQTLKCAAGTKETLGDRCVKRVLQFVEEKGRVPEKLIRVALGNNPDISKALRRLLKERRVQRLGNGRKDSAYVYMAAPAGFCELQVLKTSPTATATAGNHFSLQQPTPAVSQVGSCSASKCFEGAAPYAISSCASG